MLSEFKNEAFSQFKDEALPQFKDEASELLFRKAGIDIANARRWDGYSLIASGVGLAFTLAGIAVLITTGAIAGPVTGLIAGGVSTVAGLIINVFNHLVFNPAGSARAQANDTCRILLEEFKRENATRMLEGLDGEDRQRYRKLIISKYFDLPGPTLEGKANEKPKRLPPG
jgi:hypothetical protein